MDGEEALVYEDSSKRRRATELKPGGADEPVTVANVKEYLRLYARHRLLGAIEPQVRAFRAGLGVFFKEEILSNLRTCCSVAEIQLLLCGAPQSTSTTGRAPQSTIRLSTSDRAR